MSDFLLSDIPLDVSPHESSTRDSPGLTDLSEACGAIGVGDVSDGPPADRPPSPVPAPPADPGFAFLDLALPTSSLGVAIPVLGAVGAGAAGGMYAGIWGAATGVAASGTIVNLIRYVTSKSSDPQAASAHLMFAVVSGVAAAYTGHRAYRQRLDRATRATSIKTNKETPRWLTKR